MESSLNKAQWSPHNHTVTIHDHTHSTGVMDAMMGGGLQSASAEHTTLRVREASPIFREIERESKVMPMRGFFEVSVIDLSDDEIVVHGDRLVADNETKARDRVLLKHAQEINEKYDADDLHVIVRRLGDVPE